MKRIVGLDGGESRDGVNEERALHVIAALTSRGGGETTASHLFFDVSLYHEATCISSSSAGPCLQLQLTLHLVQCWKINSVICIHSASLVPASDFKHTDLFCI